MSMACSWFCRLRSRVRPVENSKFKLLASCCSRRYSSLQAKRPALGLSLFWEWVPLGRASRTWTARCPRWHLTLHSEASRTHSCHRLEAFPPDHDLVQSCSRGGAAAPRGPQSTLRGPAAALTPAPTHLGETDWTDKEFRIDFFFPLLMVKGEKYIP